MERYSRRVSTLTNAGLLLGCSLALGGCIAPSSYGQPHTVAMASTPSPGASSTTRRNERPKNAPAIDPRLPAGDKPIPHPYPDGNKSTQKTNPNEGSGNQFVIQRWSCCY
jgi:hypothetical protein